MLDFDFTITDESGGKYRFLHNDAVDEGEFLVNDITYVAEDSPELLALISAYLNVINYAETVGY